MSAEQLDRSINAKRSPAIWLWPMRITVVAVFAYKLVDEWNRWPNGTPLLGPLGMIWYNGPDPASILLCVALLPLVFAYLIRPSVPTALLSLLGFFLWWFAGIVAAGIGC